MKLEDAGEFDGAQSYFANCEGCGQHQIHIRTQKDDNPEYYTTVLVACPNSKCDEWIVFKLPVN